MTQALDKLTIKGFKSIRALEDFELTNLNVLIGGNGAGKSNFIDFFRMLRAMMELSLPDIENPSLQTYIEDGGGSDDFLFNGPRITKQIEIVTKFGDNGYRFKLTPTTDETFIINDEGSLYKTWWEFGSGHTSPKLLKDKDNKGKRGEYIYDAISSWNIYHFHDTSKNAPMRRSRTVDDNKYLRFDAANIAPFLLALRAKARHKNNYDQIVDTVRLVTPFFDNFVLEPNPSEKVRLNWHQKGSDYPLTPHHLSDGTLRFICLTTALLQPNPPSTIIIDEPELGLHPYAIEILAELIAATAKKTQLIISTQSPSLVDYFEPENIIVVNREKGASVFKRLNNDDLSSWLEDYSLGDLWRKNIVTGGLLMNSVDIYIVVEGQTEQTFVREVLAPQMAHRKIYLHPALIGKPGHKGGDIRFDKAKNDIGNFLRQRNDTYITTMFDYFRIGSEWPGKADVLRQLKTGTTLTAIQKAEILEDETRQEIVRTFPGCDSENRFIPYIEMHEFEALLFSDADILAEKTEIDAALIRRILEKYDNPEEINDDPVNAPGKRLVSLKDGYRKVAMGKTISEAIGIAGIRRQCPHFNDWLTKLEQLKLSCR